MLDVMNIIDMLGTKTEWNNIYVISGKFGQEHLTFTYVALFLEEC